MKYYTKPTIEITSVDSGESIMVVSSANINGNKIKKFEVDSESNGVNMLSNWHS
jgi:hypothetical protein